MPATDPAAAAREVLRAGAGCLDRAASAVGADFLAAARALARPESFTLVLGVGKSGHIGSTFAASLISTGHRAFFLHPQEALHGDLGLAAHGTLAVLLSHSGGAEELLVLAPTLRDFGARIVTVAARRDCVLARSSDWIVETLVEEEAGLHGVVPTSSSTTTLSVCHALMMASLTLRGFSLEEFRRYHPGGFLGRKLTRVADVMTPVEALPWLGPDSSVWEVLEAISLGGRGFGVVSERPRGAEVAVAETGLISDGDIRRAVRERGTFTTRTAGTMMTRHPTAISQDALMVEALRLMEANRFSFLLCRDDAGRLTGAVQMHDIVARDLDVTVRADRLPDPPS